MRGVSIYARWRRIGEEYSEDLSGMAGICIGMVPVMTYISIRASEALSPCRAIVNFP